MCIRDRHTAPDDIVTFRAGIDEDAKDVKDRISELFNSVKSRYKDVMDKGDEIALDPASVDVYKRQIIMYGFIYTCNRN